MSYVSWSVVFGEQPSAAKWNILGANDAYFDSLVGSGSAFGSFTPVWTSLTVGTGGSAANEGFFQVIGKQMSGFTRTVLGSSGSSVGTSPVFNPPATVSSHYNTSYNYPVGQSWLTDAGVQQYIGPVSLIGGKFSPSTQIVNNVGGYSIVSGIGASVPIASWAAGDSIQTFFTNVEIA